MNTEYYKKYEPIFNSWYIKALLGEGSFGKVFEIERQDFGVTYKAALKAITIPQSQSEIKSVMSDGMDEASATSYFRQVVEDIVSEFVLMSKLKGNSNIVSYEDHIVVEHKEGIGWDILIRMELLTSLIDHIHKEKLSRKDVIKLEIYRHSDNTMGFGIYSAERSPSFNFVDIGAQGYIAGGSINFFKGDYYVKLRTYSKKEKVLKDEETLARRVASLLPGDNAMPPVLSQFPREGKKPNEEVYIHESVLGHNFLGKAFKAAYQTGSDEFSVFISDGNSPEEVKETAHKYIATAGTAAVETGDSKIMITDGYNGTIFLAWKDKRLVIISGLAKDQADIADRYSTEILK